MCAPIILGLVSTAMQMKAQREQGEFQAKQAEHNALLAEFQKRDIKQRATFEAGDVTRAGRAASASALAGRATSGVEGGGPDFLEGFDAASAADAIRANAARQAWGLEQEQQDLKFQSKAAKKAGVLGSIGTGLSGVGQAAGGFARSRRQDAARTANVQSQALKGSGLSGKGVL